MLRNAEGRKGRGHFLVHHLPPSLQLRVKAGVDAGTPVENLRPLDPRWAAAGFATHLSVAHHSRLSCAAAGRECLDWTERSGKGIRREGESRLSKRDSMANGLAYVPPLHAHLQAPSS